MIDSVPIQIHIYLSDKADNITSCGCNLSYDMFPGDDGDWNCARIQSKQRHVPFVFISCFFSRLRGTIVGGDRRIRSHGVVKVLGKPIDAWPGRVVVRHELQNKSCIYHPRPVDYFPNTLLLRDQDVPSQDIAWHLPTSALPLLGNLKMAVATHQHFHVRLKLPRLLHDVVILRRSLKFGPNCPK